jgi:hypothetical protein
MADNIPIKDKVRIALKDCRGEVLSRQKIIDLVIDSFPSTNRASVIPSDYCYNLYNRGIAFDFHILEWLERNRYKVLGLGYTYEGSILWRGKQVGEWRKGSPRFWEAI